MTTIDVLLIMAAIYGQWIAFKLLRFVYRRLEDDIRHIAKS